MKATRINPLLVVKDINESVDFYEQTLGFKKNTVIKSDGGGMRYVDFIVGSSVLMLVPKSTRPESTPSSAIELYIDIAEDIKAVFADLQRSGLKFVKELYVTPWGTYQFHFKDPDGYLLIVSQDKNG